MEQYQESHQIAEEWCSTALKKAVLNLMWSLTHKHLLMVNCSTILRFLSSDLPEHNCDRYTNNTYIPSR